MNRERLSRLADLMDEVQELIDQRKATVGFNLNYWGDIRPDLRAKSLQVETECGTTACACGYAALHPWFQREGLRLYLSYKHDGVNTKLDIRDPRHLNEMRQRSTEENWESFKLYLRFGNGNDSIFSKGAVMDFFGIPVHVAERLFYPYAYERDEMQPKTVAARIREVLRRHDD